MCSSNEIYSNGYPSWQDRYKEQKPKYSKPEYSLEDLIREEEKDMSRERFNEEYLGIPATVSDGVIIDELRDKNYKLQVKVATSMAMVNSLTSEKTSLICSNADQKQFIKEYTIFHKPT